MGRAATISPAQRPRPGNLGGLTYEFGTIVERLTALTGTKARRVAVIGGGARNDFWLQLKADVSNLSLEVCAVEEAAALGAALLAGVGAGIWKGPVEAAQHVDRACRTVIPQPEMAKRYRPYLRLYRRLYPTLAGLHAELEKLAQS